MFSGDPSYPSHSTVSRVCSRAGLLPVLHKGKDGCCHPHLLCTPGSMGSSLPSAFQSFWDRFPCMPFPSTSPCSSVAAVTNFPEWIPGPLLPHYLLDALWLLSFFWQKQSLSTKTKNNLQRKGFTSSYRFQSIMKAFRAGTWRQEPK